MFQRCADSIDAPPFAFATLPTLERVLSGLIERGPETATAEGRVPRLDGRRTGTSNNNGWPVSGSRQSTMRGDGRRLGEGNTRIEPLPRPAPLEIPY